MRTAPVSQGWKTARGGDLPKCGTSMPTTTLDRRTPWHRDFAITRTAFFDVGKRGEGIMESLHQHPFGGQHVVDPAAGSFRLRAILVVEGMPARVARKQERHVGH